MGRLYKRVLELLCLWIDEKEVWKDLVGSDGGIGWEVV